MRENGVLGDSVVGYVDKFQFLRIKKSYRRLVGGWYRGGDQADDALAGKGRRGGKIKRGKWR